MQVHSAVEPKLSRTVTARPPRNLANGVCSFGDSLGETVGLMGATMPFSRNVEIYGESEPAEYVYRLLRGAVRTYKLLQDGRRQVGGFYLPGDVFGLEAGEVHRLTAEAIADSTVVVVKRSAILSLAARDADFARKLWTTTAQELEHVQDLMLTLGRKTAQERVAGFLLEMSARNLKNDLIELPMSRQDIADYLGLTIETVSRTITQIEDSAAIDLRDSRRIFLRNRAALTQMSG